MSRSSPPAPTACPTSSLRRMRSSPTRRRRAPIARPGALRDRKSTRLNSSHSQISYAVFCLKKKKNSHLAVRVSSPLVNYSPSPCHVSSFDFALLDSHPSSLLAFSLCFLLLTPILVPVISIT